MKKIFILASIIIVFYTSQAISQDNNVDSSSSKVENYIFNYVISYFEDFRAVLYLYRMQLDEEPGSLDDIRDFIDDYNINYDVDKLASLQYSSNDDGSSKILFTLKSGNGVQHLLGDNIVILSVSGSMKLGAPIAKGSSIATLSGEIQAGEILYDPGVVALLKPFTSYSYLTSLNIETVQKVANMNK